MLALIVAAFLPACPADTTAQPGMAAARAGVTKARIGRPPATPCLDADGHLAVPPLRFDAGRDRLRREGRATVARLADWLHDNPLEALRIHSVYPISWIRGARPALERAEAIRRQLLQVGIAPARVSVRGQDVLIPDDAPDARARRRAARDLWFERRPYQPAGPVDCAAACAALGRCAADGPRCVPTAEGCATSMACRRVGACQLLAGACVARTDADCASSLMCTQRGACARVGGVCLARTASDCATTEGCVEFGLCSPINGRCARASDADCARSHECRSGGQCSFEGGACVAKTRADCRRSETCTAHGNCAPKDGGCVARARRDCARSRRCTESGACTPRDGDCRATRDADCRASARCRVHGLCSVVAHSCGAKTAADCAGSRACTKHGRCRPSPRGDCQR